MRAISVYIICWLSSSACTGELIPIDPNPGAALDGGGATALAFRPTIQEDLAGIGCAVAGCHGAPVTVAPMPLVAAPANEDEWQDNYEQVKARAGTEVTSLLISKANGAGGHVAPLESGHPMLDRWRAWIAAGAPYMATGPDQTDAGAGVDAGSVGDATATAGLTWERDVSPIMRARCTECHGTQGAYSLETYQAALGFGTDGIPNVLPGDPLSLLLQYCEQGHEGIGAAEALQVAEWVVDWNAAER